MRKLICVAILLSLFAAPITRLDVAKLQPVEVVAVYREDEKVVLLTDTESRGEGGTVAQALADLKNSTPTVVYLDTAQYLLVAENGEDCVGDLKSCLKDSVKVGKYSFSDPSEEALYQQTHGEMARLKDWNKQE